MKFNYTYQKVLDLKTNEKTQAEWMLSAAIGELQAEQRSLLQLQEDRQRVIAAIQEMAEKSSSLSQLQEMQQYADYLDHCIQKKIEDVDYAERKVEVKQAQLNNKMLDEKVWLKAKEKALSVFQQQVLLREQSELDEMASVRFAMNTR
ncbi:flagellar export protein FliJ [Paenibacillus sp. CAA11]|uniref:flagellar export protein FliJ n=1 Tax=Paenibacillus sp. CAA11 TaxID=1532905 RepID=UPI000D38DE56|nr:flagellar export protein FliJ [Paenibacillus sp. CAA11]AWB44296.1 flagellar export protein FliJ [Paenibacillus sp. CAA11]